MALAWSVWSDFLREWVVGPLVGSLITVPVTYLITKKRNKKNTLPTVSAIAHRRADSNRLTVHLKISPGEEQTKISLIHVEKAKLFHIEDRAHFSCVPIMKEEFGMESLSVSSLLIDSQKVGTKFEYFDFCLECEKIENEAKVILITDKDKWYRRERIETKIKIEDVLRCSISEERGGRKSLNIR